MHAAREPGWENIAVAITATTRARRMNCRKHAFARRASFYPRIVPSSVRVLPDEWCCSPSLDLPSGRDRNDDYIYGPSDTPVEEVSLSSSTSSYMTYTPSDSTWLITNASGDEVAFYGYDAFGNSAFGTPTSPFGYAGEYADPSTGFSNLRARWYAPQTGEFTTRDPAFASTDTAYTYAGDDPVNGTDPSGLEVLTNTTYCSPSSSGVLTSAPGGYDASPGNAGTSFIRISQAPDALGKFLTVQFGNKNGTYDASVVYWTLDIKISNPRHQILTSDVKLFSDFPSDWSIKRRFGISANYGSLITVVPHWHALGVSWVAWTIPIPVEAHNGPLKVWTWWY